MPASQTPLVVTMLTVQFPSNDADAGAMLAAMKAIVANAPMAQLLVNFSKVAVPCYSALGGAVFQFGKSVSPIWFPRPAEKIAAEFARRFTTK
jgi:hypothetical protein